MKKNHRLSDQLLQLQQLEENFSCKCFRFPSPLPIYFSSDLSLFAQLCAIGVMLRVCRVICCYASSSGMWIHSLFYSGFLPSCQKRTNRPVNNRQHSLKQCVTRWRKEVCLVFFFRIRKCYRVRLINAFILRFCVKTYSEWLDGWLVGWRERMGMGERRDYVNEIKKKKCRVCSSRVSPCASPPLLSLALPLCRMSDPVSAAPLPAGGLKPSDTNKTQTKTPDVPCAGPWARTHQTLTLSRPISIHLVFLSPSFIHT